MIDCAQPVYNQVKSDEDASAVSFHDREWARSDNINPLHVDVATVFKDGNSIIYILYSISQFPNVQNHDNLASLVLTHIQTINTPFQDSKETITNVIQIRQYFTNDEED